MGTVITGRRASSLRPAHHAATTHRPIGDNDVWIGATALADRMTLVSRNARHFARVPGRLIEEH